MKNKSVINDILLSILDINLRWFGGKKQFLPSSRDIENEELKGLANILKGDSDKEKLTNILEWEDRNLPYWKERGILELPWVFLKLIYLFICILIAALISLGIYFIILPFLGTGLPVYFGLLVFLIFLIWFIKQDTLSIAINAVLLSYPIYEAVRLFLMSSPSNGSMIDLGLMVASINGVLFGASLFTLVYIASSYLPLFRGDSAWTKFSKILMIMSDTFKFDLSVEKVLNHKFAICRDYAKLTASLLFRLYPDIKVYFFIIPQHVAAAIKIENEYFILDQKLPVLKMDGWLKRWGRNDACVYASELGLDSKGKLIDISFKKHEKVYLSDFTVMDVNTDELTEKVSKILGISQISKKEKSDFKTLRLKNYAIYDEDNDIVKHSLIRAIKNKLENEFCGNINKITKIKIIQDKKYKRDFIVEVCS